MGTASPGLAAVLQKSQERKHYGQMGGAGEALSRGMDSPEAAGNSRHFKTIGNRNGVGCSQLQLKERDAR